MIPNAMAVANGKGGSGKSSLASHVAGLAARAGLRVLAVDLDPQGNLGQDLGYWQDDKSDEGRSLHGAVLADAPLVPLKNVRPNLDAVAAGEEYTNELIDTLRQRQGRNRERIKDLERALATIAADYDLVVLDCPVNKVMEEAALASAHWVVIPTKADQGSTRGLEAVARRFLDLRRDGLNPDLELLGVVLFDLGASDRRMNAEARSELAEALDGIAPVFEGFIRNARMASRDMRRDGILAVEYEEAAKQFSGQLAGNAATLAQDYRAITQQILSTVAPAARVQVAG